MTIQCPNCKGYKTNTDRATSLALGAGLTLFGFLFSVFIFPLIFAVVGIGILITAACKKAKRFTCKTCGYNGVV